MILEVWFDENDFFGYDRGWKYGLYEEGGATLATGGFSTSGALIRAVLSLNSELGDQVEIRTSGAAHQLRQELGDTQAP